MTSHVTRVIGFEGIATLDVEGVGHDAYMSIHMEALGYTTRWYGTFSWMGDGPESFPSVPSVVDLTLSDGREGKIRIPYGPPEGDKFEFLGIGLPPGFENLLPAHRGQLHGPFPGEGVELVSTTPSVRRIASYVFGFTSLGFLASSFWLTDHALSLAGTAFCFIVAAIAVTPRTGYQGGEV